MTKPIVVQPATGSPASEDDNRPLEGAPNVLEYRIFGRIDDSHHIDLRVDINNRQPTAAMLRNAHGVVNGIRFPRWRTLARC